MAYFTQTDLEVLIPAGWVVDALDDDADGTQDATLFSELQTVVEGEINASLGQRYTVPIAAGVADDWLRHAAVHLAAFQCYARRQAMEFFPYAATVEMIRERLERMARGEEALAPGADREEASVTAITEDRLTHQSGGGLAS